MRYLGHTSGKQSDLMLYFQDVDKSLFLDLSGCCFSKCFKDTDKCLNLSFPRVVRMNVLLNVNILSKSPFLNF